MALPWKRRYLDLLARMPSDYIWSCLIYPAPYMRPIHCALHRIALRRKKDPRWSRDADQA